MLSLSAFAQAAESQQTQNTSINLYLPISSYNQQEFHHDLNAYLEKNGLSNINIVFANHWHEFQQRLKNGLVGIYWTPPHFAAWAINKNEFKPLFRVAEPLSYVIAAKRTQPEIFELNDLIGRTVCMQSPLNLDYLISSSVFNNLLGAIKTKFVRQVSDQMTAQETDCRGFVVSDHVVRKKLINGNDNYIRLYQGNRYNNYALLAHPSISPVLIGALQELMIKTQTQEILRPLSQLSANEVKLISAKKSDYPISYLKDLNRHW